MTVVDGPDLDWGATKNEKEVIRIIGEHLVEHGYHEAAETLARESGVAREDSVVSELKLYIKDGRWQDALKTIRSLIADTKKAEFIIHRQEYYELVSSKQLPQAVDILRSELTPNGDLEEIQRLASLLLCADRVTPYNHRQEVMRQLEELISKDKIVPFNRLSTLLEQSRVYQEYNCRYHLESATHTWLEDHKCPNEALLDFRIAFEGARHKDEVWCVAYSPDGEMIASGGKDKIICFWRHINQEWHLELTVEDLNDAPTRLAFSPDNSKLLVGCHNGEWKIWDLVSKAWFASNRSIYTQSITSCVWIGAELFATSSRDKNVCLWSTSNSREPEYQWLGARTHDLCYTNQKLFMAINDKTLYAVEPFTKQEFLRMDLDIKHPVTSLNQSNEQGRLLVGLATGEILLVDYYTRKTVRSYTGSPNSKYILRASLGGINNSLVASGSCDGLIYIWSYHKEEILRTLSVCEGKGKAVSELAWSPKDPHCFVSVSDDHRVVIWTC